ncbi:MAG: EVE domain-containing protein [Leptospiraceae bacterium]|nr:EVE domain-containing protein [Leptospiraceae bacterium]
MSSQKGRGVSYWVGVASLDHVRVGAEAGFCQFCHGKPGPVNRLQAGDWIVYYSPRESMRTGKPVQAFTAIGQVCGEKAYQAQMSGFAPFRKDVRFVEAKDASIHPMLQQLSFTRGRKSWGMMFRSGFFQISVADFYCIAEAMGVENRIGNAS